MCGLLAACVAAPGADGGSLDSGTPDAGGADASLGDASVLVGTFQVRLVPPVEGDGGTAGFTSVVGKVYDGPMPELVRWERQASDGDCTLLTPRVPFCAAGCGGSSACVENDTCQAYPAARSVGAVQVTGLRTSAGATSFSMSPVVNTYQPSAELPYPAFAPGDTITFAAAGAYFPAFSLTSTGVDPLTLGAGALVLTQGQPLAVTWSAPTTGSARVHLKLDISHHGGSKGKIECDTADDGALSIGAGLIGSLLNLGVAGFPTIVVTRSAVGSAVISAGRVDLDVTADVEQSVTIPGLRSCTADADCADAGVCQSDLTCR